MRLLLLESNVDLALDLKNHLKEEAHVVDWFVSVEDADWALSVALYDMLLVDEGCATSSFVRHVLGSARQRISVIAWTSVDDVAGRIDFLAAGADDILPKPFSFEELSARIRAVSRPYRHDIEMFSAVTGFSVDRNTRMIVANGETLRLSVREWAILERLLKTPNAIVSQPQLYDVLYDLCSAVKSNTVEVYISKLRQKIGRDRIKTVRGVGYMFAME